MNENEQVTIYALIDDSDAVRYVGRSRYPETRLMQHITLRDGGTRKLAWLQDMLARGVRPRLRVLAVTDAEHAPALEHEYIARYRAAGANLTNGHPGWQAGHVPVQLPPRVRFLFTLRPEVARELREAAVEEGLPMAAVARRCLLLYLRQRRQQHEAQP